MNDAFGIGLAIECVDDKIKKKLVSETLKKCSYWMYGDATAVADRDIHWMIMLEYQ